MTILMDIVQGILGNGIGLLRDWLDARRKTAQAQLETTLAIQKAKVESVTRITEGRALHEIQWESLMAEGSKDSWKDEWFTIVLSLPFLLSMVGLSSWADRAFEAMTKAPMWYTYAFLVAVGASFGVRIWNKIPGFGDDSNNKPATQNVVEAFKALGGKEN